MNDPTAKMANGAAPNIPLALAPGSKGPEHLITDGFDAEAQVTGLLLVISTHTFCREWV